LKEAANKQPLFLFLNLKTILFNLYTIETTANIRLNKYISDTGMCSRREADRLIEAGKVSVNGTVASLGTKVVSSDSVLVNGKAIAVKEATIYIAFNKPVGITCTTDTNEKNNIIDFIKHPKRIFPIGRLDNPSEGLIFLTNDGDIVNKILRAGNNHEKEYIVSVNKPITNEFITKMSNGIPILDTITKKCIVKKESNFTFKIILTQGLNRQIRKMCSYLNYNVITLKRIRIMNVSLGELKTGTWRNLTHDEINEINKLVSTSIKTEEASFPKQI
jgi:23S rRNA pseudouridine2604 synthase